MSSTERATSGAERGEEPPVQSDAGPSAPTEDEPAVAELEAPGPAPPRGAVPKVLVPRWIQLVSLPLTVIGLVLVIRAAKGVVLLFVVAGVIALILNPVVAFLQRRSLPRGIAVLAVYVGFFITLAAIGFFVSSAVVDQINSFAKDVPHLIKHANRSLLDFQRTLNKHGIHVHLIKQGKTALQTLQEKVLKESSTIASFGGSVLTKLVSVGFDAVLVFVLSVYMLLYGEKIGVLVRRIMPPGDGTPQDDYPTRVQRAVSSYVRGQLLFSLVMGTTTALSLYLFGVIGVFPDGRTYAVAFGVFDGVMELIPYVGPVLAAVPPVLVALFSNPITALWVALLFLALQQLEGHIVAPQIFSHTLRINPLLVILALLLGDAIYGLVGAIIALPCAAVLRETGLYLWRHLELEGWERGHGL
ncbi:MAG TPA: AI-2E family transporter [Solirubrobacteraceae bacterium]|jgi:predicted PurR-regulated permease PerM|nr:AI-2E family transporter [Solirubrobacteraceae bacterium]